MEYIKHTYKKAAFFFDSYGFTGFKVFIEKDDHDIINKILYDTKKFNKDDVIVTLITLTFSRGNYEKLSKNQVSKLSPTAANLFHLIDEFLELNNVKKEVMLHFIDDQLQDLTSYTCGIFQLYFYRNLFDPLKKSNLINDEKLTKNTIVKQLNELFSMSDEQNEKVVEQFAQDYDNKRE